MCYRVCRKFNIIFKCWERALNSLIGKKHFTFEQLLNLEHYKEIGITLDRNKHLFKLV